MSHFKLLVPSLATFVLISCGETQSEDSNLNRWNESKKAYDSTSVEPWDKQPKTNAAIPGGTGFNWGQPTTSYDDFGGFYSYQSHEGVDYVSNRGARPEILASLGGEVVYVRVGCQQQSEFGSNINTPYRTTTYTNTTYKREKSDFFNSN